jgi:hypothetical protein
MLVISNGAIAVIYTFWKYEAVVLCGLPIWLFTPIVMLGFDGAKLALVISSGYIELEF